MTQKVLIIGGVAAGPKTACRLKRLQPECAVTIVDQDSFVSYGGCGIPYYVSGDVNDEVQLRQTSFHVTRDPDFFARAKGVEVRTRTRALAIDRKGKTVLVENLDNGARIDLPYDKLVLATGSRPKSLPIPGADLPNVFTVTDLHKAIAVKEMLAKGKVGRAVIIGGGFIGVEMAEAFADLWGVETTLIEFMPQLLPNIVDRTFADMLATVLRKNKVAVHTGQSARRIEADTEGRACRVVTDNLSVEADIVIMAVGVTPNSELARDAGLLVSNQGGIVVNGRMQTSDPDIYAAGDCVEIAHLVTGGRSIGPLGSLANRQGRVAADNIAGIPSRFDGWLGSFIMKAFDSCISATGISLAVAKREGFDAVSVYSAQSDRAHFFPQQTVIPLQMVVDRRNRRVLGVQGFGPFNDAVLARIDAAAALISKGATVEDFSNLEMAYAPPFATALDALNATANIADNLLNGRLRTVSVDDFLSWMENMASRPEWLALDLRHPSEAKIFQDRFADRWISLPYVDVRHDHRRLPTDRTLVIICDAGTRSYEIQCFLDSVGLGDTLVLGGGFNLIRRLGVSWWPA
ncbi:MAG: FAD-dependent oxidoreductase [Thermodesulfobacteriota bacterium]